ncbi:contractile injection system tape measure protein [Photorhabdus asymbiotica]|uniref:contractile injection system tape measure protein n=1 Tax=Photorhabdus asymbiotica TaxID=291112 RepID=UPI003DA717C3
MSLSDSASDHIVCKTVLSIETSDYNGEKIMDRCSFVFNEKLKGIITENIIGLALNSKGKLSLEKVIVDLGNIDLDWLETEMPKKLATELRNALSQYYHSSEDILRTERASYPQSIWKDAYPHRDNIKGEKKLSEDIFNQQSAMVTTHSAFAGTQLIEKVDYYLRKGYWSSENRVNTVYIGNNLCQQINHQPQQWLPMLAWHCLQPAGLNRLIQTCQPEVLRLLCQLFIESTTQKLAGSVWQVTSDIKVTPERLKAAAEYYLQHQIAYVNAVQQERTELQVQNDLTPVRNITENGSNSFKLDISEVNTLIDDAENPDISEVNTLIDDAGNPDISEVNTLIDDAGNPDISEVNTLIDDAGNPDISEVNTLIDDAGNPDISEVNTLIDDAGNPDISEVNTLIDDAGNPDISEVNTLIDDAGNPDISEVNTLIDDAENPDISEVNTLIDDAGNPDISEVNTLIDDAGNPDISEVNTLIDDAENPDISEVNTLIDDAGNPDISEVNTLIDDAGNPDISEVNTLIDDAGNPDISEVNTLIDDAENPDISEVNTLIDDAGNPDISEVNTLIDDAGNPDISEVNTLIDDAGNPDISEVNTLIDDAENPDISEVNTLIDDAGNPDISEVNTLIDDAGNPDISEVNTLIDDAGNPDISEVNTLIDDAGNPDISEVNMLIKEVGERRYIQPGSAIPTSSAQSVLSVSNAGCMILWPLLPTFFTTFGLLDKNKFISLEAQREAICLLDWLIWAEDEIPAWRLTLNKVICGLPVNDNARWRVPEPEQRTIISQWLEKIIMQLPAWKKMGASDVRYLFLQRSGELSGLESGIKIHVKPEIYDALLTDWPWPMNMACFSWLSQPLTIMWL